MSWPFFLGNLDPAKATIDQKLAYLRGGGILVAFILFFLISATLGAMFLARIAREDYRNEVDENLGELIKGAQEDLKQGKENQS